MESNGSQTRGAGGRPSDHRIAGKYRLVTRLGEGGMGEVWVALNEDLDVQVAIKLITPTARNGEVAARFVREARAAASLNHPAIVRVFDFGETEAGDLFMIMELLRGKSLGAVLQERVRLPAVEAVRTLLPIADALATAHASGIVHRDVKPDNILLAESAAGRYQPKLLDFGISIVTTGVDAKRITKRGTILGTPDYLSPEQVMALDEVTSRTDIWSYCVVLYEIMAGRRPFSGADSAQVLRAIVHDAPVPLTERAAGDAALWAIVEQGLQKAPSLRSPTIQDLGTRLAGWLLGQGATSDVTGASLHEHWPGAVEGANAPVTQRQPSLPAPPPAAEHQPGGFGAARAQHRVPSMAVRLVLVLVLGVLGYFTVRWLK